MLNTGSQGKLRGSDAEKQAVQTAGCGPSVGKVSSRTPHGQISSDPVVGSQHLFLLGQLSPAAVTFQIVVDCLGNGSCL